MPRVGEVLGILFYVYAEDHNPPHVHAICCEDEALIEISTGAVLVGLPRGISSTNRWLLAAA
jgi:hypothetical protein